MLVIFEGSDLQLTYQQTGVTLEEFISPIFKELFGDMYSDDSHFKRHFLNNLNESFRRRLGGLGRITHCS